MMEEKKDEKHHSEMNQGNGQGQPIAGDQFLLTDEKRWYMLKWVVNYLENQMYIKQ